MRVIQFSRLGKMGRWGNQVFQWAMTRLYAARHGAVAQFPSWVGKALLADARDPAIGTPLSPYAEQNDASEQPVPPDGAAAIGCDYVGWWQVHTGYWMPQERAAFRAVLEPAPAVAARMAPALARLRGLGRARVGIHIRRGDYGREIFPLTPIGWYLALLADLWPALDAPTLFVASEDPALVAEFALYNPQTAESLGVERLGPLDGYNYERAERVAGDARVLDFYPDFYLLSQCDVIIAPNSTFSFAAAMANASLRSFWRASLRVRGFERVDPWNAYPLLRERRAQFPDVDGAWLDSNPQW